MPIEENEREIMKFARAASRKWLAKEEELNPGGHPDFLWYSFSRVVGPEFLAQWNGKLAWMRERRVHVSAEVNWTWMEEVGLLEAIESFIVQSFDSVQGRFVCMAWRRLFHIQELVYKEFVVEFLAAVTFRRNIGIHESANITFCLGGERRELSLAEFAMRTELYISSEVHTESYVEFISSCIRTTKGFKEDRYWPNIANGAYSFGTT
ncbi:unnamed protein product [Lactuca virosa]|uniref:Uncharacterized protein n=1 Tax=Lactuca virosa TaxID=75947 RepID=A0AAU9MF39_9ASTR|nr:unnamed protein product [Lactuca virosa]